MLFREPEHGAIDVNILICAFPPALHPPGQPSVALPAGFPALRFPTGQNRVEPSPERNESPHPPPHGDRPRIWLDQPIQHLQQRHVDSRLPTASHPTGCLWQSTERLPRRLVPRPIMPNQPQTFAPAQLERDILDGEEFARTETVRGVEGRGSRVEG